MRLKPSPPFIAKYHIEYATPTKNTLVAGHVMSVL